MSNEASNEDLNRNIVQHEDAQQSNYNYGHATTTRRPVARHRSRIYLLLPTAFLIIAMLVSTYLILLPKIQSKAHAASAIPALANGIVQTPPMGWSSWNANFANINESVIKGAADAMVNSGMKTAGYQYINTDEGWWSGTRDSGGNITVDSNKWPDGMQGVANYIHSKGLKAGIYTDAGINGCGGNNQGSYGHYTQDMLQFERWGFDYVKVDWCGGVNQGLNPPTQYGQIRDAIASATATTGHPMGFSICIWGLSDPWNWGPTTGNLWRTSNDISFTQGGVAWTDILKNFDSGTLHANAQAPGAYNDLDMMEVGANGISNTESQAHFSLWAIAGAPLLAGNNIATMSSTTQGILTNSEVIAVDQDPLDLQGIKVSEPTIGLQVWSKVLSGSGQRAVALLNRTSSTANITVQWNDLGLASGSAQVRDLWAHNNVGSFSNSYTASVPSHGVTMLKISGTEGSQAVYEAESSANTLAGSAVVQTCSSCSGGKNVGYIGNTNGGNGTLQFNNIQANTSGPHVITIAYVNGDSTQRTASMSVNGAATSTVNFPPTGGWSTVKTLDLVLNMNGGSNTIKFSNSSAWAPDFDKINVLAPQTPTATRYEAESSSNNLAGGAVVRSCSTCSGGQLVGNVGNGGGGNGTLQFNNVNVSASGSHQLVISYINGDSSTFGIGTSRTASMSINGGNAVTVSFPSTGDWNEVVTVTLNVNLNAGNNNIKFSNGSAWAPDFDKIDVA